MTGVINRFPVGLLTLLDMKSRGQTPRLLHSEVQAGVDVFDNYLLDTLTGVQTTAGAAVSPGTFAIHTVPSGEVWYVYGGAIFSNAALAAGVTMRVTAGLILPGQGLVEIFPGPITAGPTEIMHYGYQVRRWLPPGAQLLGVLSSVAGAGAATTHRLNLARLTI